MRLSTDSSHQKANATKTRGLLPSSLSSPQRSLGDLLGRAGAGLLLLVVRTLKPKSIPQSFAFARLAGKPRLENWSAFWKFSTFSSKSRDLLIQLLILRAKLLTRAIEGKRGKKEKKKRGGRKGGKGGRA